jgi:hypothetical protein
VAHQLFIYSLKNKAHMKKTTMLIVLLVVMTVAAKAQSIAQIQDTISAVAPHLPAVHRWTTADGKKWHGLNSTFTHETQDTVVNWIAVYPSEANDYFAKVGVFLNTTDPATLSTTDAEKYYDIHAIWIMIHAND